MLAGTVFFVSLILLCWDFIRQCKIDDFKRHLRQMDASTLQRYLSCDELSKRAKKLVKAENQRRTHS